jgi:regulator of sigma E protease
VVDLTQFYELLKQAGNGPIALSVKRGESTENLPLTPAAPVKNSDVPYLGVSWGRMTLVHPNPAAQIADAVATIRSMVDALFSPKSDVKAQHFSGPVGILRAYYGLFNREEGWRLALAFSVFFNVNLAIFNMLPFPVLDGGHITLAIVESIRRRPINARFLEYVQTACALLVMGFIAYVTFYDLGDLTELVSGKKSPAAATQPAAAEISTGTR